MRFSRSFGQVFLSDKNYIKKIVKSLEIDDEYVCEIGPGRGELTLPLSKRAKHLYCIEVDFRLVSILKDKFAHLSHVTIIHHDILKFSLAKLKKKLIVFGNVPYQISNRLVRYLVENRQQVKRAYLTYQREFADKLLAEVSAKPYGFLSCYFNYYAKAKHLFDIPPEAFSPQPKVASSFLRVDFYPRPVERAENEEFLFGMIKDAFSQRRKKIINSLPCLKGKKQILSSLGINPLLRADQISLGDYLRLANQLVRASKGMVKR